MTDKSIAKQIDDIIEIHGGWKAELLTQLRTAIKSIDPDVVEEVKWKTPSRPEGLPVWSHDGMICVSEIWKDNVQLLFSKGSQLNDPAKLFNARLESSEIRAIKFHEGDQINEDELKSLIIEAIELNQAKRR